MKTFKRYTNYKEVRQDWTDDLNHVPGILNIYLAYYHCQQQNMIPTLSYLSSIFFIGLECNEIFR